ncbi:MAG: hypothetical protein LBT24_02600 [Tannerella sp.]|jgi:hypothetical protein|nr:hypothetical protein [Tannerella sp.]
MLQTVSLDTKTLLLKAEHESDMSELLAYLNRTAKEKKENLLNRFLDFAKDNYTTDPSFKFNREEYYDKENIR